MTRTLSNPRLMLRTLREEFVRGSQPCRVDREAGIIYGVKVLGHESGNGDPDGRLAVTRRLYPDPTMRGAVNLYEGAEVYVNHSRDSRKAEDAFGWLMNVRVEADGIYADLHYLKSHPMADRITEAAERRPQMFGMSHDAHGQTEQQGNTLVVRKIERVNSVDVVVRSATTNSLFESNGAKHMANTALPRTKLTPTALARLIEADEYDVIPDDMPAGESSASYEEHLGAMVAAIMSDGELDKAAKRKKLLKALDLLDAGEEDTVTEEDDVDKKKDGEGVQESLDDAALKNPLVKKLLERLGDLEDEVGEARKQKQANKLCDDAKLPAELRTPVFMESLVTAKNEAAMKRLIEDRKALGFSKPPRSSSGGGAGDRSSGTRVTESRNNDRPSGGKEFASALRGR